MKYTPENTRHSIDRKIYKSELDAAFFIYLLKMNSNTENPHQLKEEEIGINIRVNNKPMDLNWFIIHYIARVMEFELGVKYHGIGYDDLGKTLFITSDDEYYYIKGEIYLIPRKLTDDEIYEKVKDIDFLGTNPIG